MLKNLLEELVLEAKLHQQYETIASNIGHNVVMPDGEKVGDKVIFHGNRITEVRMKILKSVTEKSRDFSP
jgi:hypothetical protein